VLSLTILLGTMFPRRGLAAGLAGAFVAVSFVLKSIAGIAKSDISDALAQLSIFQHADALTVIRTGFAPLTALILLVVAIVMTLGAVGVFQRRDLVA
jgi:hypothetical protein